MVRAVGTGVAWEDKWIGLPCHQVGRDPQGGRSAATGMHFVGEIDSDINKTGKLFQNKVISIWDHGQDTEKEINNERRLAE